MVAMELAINRPEKLITPAGHLSLKNNQLSVQVHHTVTHKLSFLPVFLHR